jgi:hypothetical protein
MLNLLPTLVLSKLSSGPGAVYQGEPGKMTPLCSLPHSVFFIFSWREGLHQSQWEANEFQGPAMLEPSIGKECMCAC